LILQAVSFSVSEKVGSGKVIRPRPPSVDAKKELKVLQKKDRAKQRRQKQRPRGTRNEGELTILPGKRGG